MADTSSGGGIETLDHTASNLHRQAPTERRGQIPNRSNLVDRSRDDLRNFSPSDLTPQISLEGRLVSKSIRLRIFLKRLGDLLTASLLLALTAPLMIIVALLVKLTSNGPVFFCQQRVGRGGKSFAIIKFRSMHVGTSELLQNDESLYSSYVENGYKLTPTCGLHTTFGRILRITSLDELPQLLNVLNGTMSMVGVRPLLADELAERDERAQALYKLFRPGMTGLWQISGRNSVSVEERWALDRSYLSGWSLTLDFKILLLTPRAVLRTSATS